MKRHAVLTSAAPEPIGPYSQAATMPGLSLLFLSGQAPVDPSTGKLVEGGAEDQTRQAFHNLAQVLSEAGLGWDNVVKVNVYLTAMADFEAMNSVYQETFSEPFPARTTVAVAGLPLGARVEIELVAVR
ncbi:MULTISPECIES: Rid family detoxifying hydrolase [unclassified Arthrobacter]|uniref:Rid family detoxifying hydrolase n=1 Tax=unclassified Arthrobacter TaxID=235627 RepID=UPI00159E986D|nr:MULTISPECIES: Rid family detoxifying hydrolase [unclassified Arthrobacter]MCQ9165858.1 Rid family detoxifying hydrolase [Arthrobacter sp. STN4]NVM99707.1 RidA family protein [Arthrobacter sp. SDTb3-6]